MAVAATRVLGLVLAGGRSVRFGAEKAMAEVDGLPMIAGVVERLSEACEVVAVNAPPGGGAARWAREAQEEAEPLPVLPDAAGAPDGPLAGVSAGLAWAAAEGAQVLVTAPCDTPRLPWDLARRLVDGRGEAATAVAVTPEGWQPLCAAWDVRRRGDLAPFLAAPRHPPMREVLRALGAVEVTFASAADFANVNTRVELAALPPPEPPPPTRWARWLDGLRSAGRRRG